MTNLDKWAYSFDFLSGRRPETRRRGIVFDPHVQERKEVQLSKSETNDVVIEQTDFTVCSTRYFILFQVYLFQGDSLMPFAL